MRATHKTLRTLAFIEETLRKADVPPLCRPMDSIEAHFWGEVIEEQANEYREAVEHLRLTFRYLRLPASRFRAL